ncbi:hypothetical protein FA95DRAFT_1413846 [Auriscalpium vulgare]|uniref:Uncharacterized protein n=1 Tax=Auriscalpium vulgare TaxID=40419 RepID=A0ACB8RRB2_9AGAM|nr:hypothetical protein FA95DRAFT_1413846 [Auriscalpium vulgare]
MHAESLNAEQHNALLPIARIPPDILITIFSLLAAGLKDVFINESYKLEGLDWLAVTHVCRSWRHVAIQDARLWADNLIVPFLFGQRWVSTFLSRAQQAPLTIYQGNLRRPDYQNPFDLEFVIANLARIRVLRLRFEDADLHALCTPAPLLEYFHTTLDASFKRLSYPVDDVSPSLPHGLFGGAAGAPVLRHVCATIHISMPMSWTSPLFAGLTSLEVSAYIPRSGGPAAEIAAIVDALDRMPSLERFVLSLYQSREQWVEVPPSRRIVALAGLRDLDLDADTVPAALLLSHITLPADATVNCVMNAYDVDNPVPETAAVFAAAATCIFHSAAASRVHLNLADFGRRILIELKAWRSTDAYTSPPAFSLKLCPHRDHPGGGNASARLRTVMAALASENLEELALCGDGPVATWVHHDALERARRLRRLTVEGRAAFALFAVPRGDILPALSVLSIAGVDLRTVSDAGVTMEDRLVRYLEARADAGAEGPAEMDVVACEVDDEFVRRARAAVPGLVVRWRKDDGEGAEL